MTEHSSIRHCFALALWQTAKTAPAPTMFALVSRERGEFLDGIIRDAAQLNRNSVENLDASEIEIYPRRVADRPVGIIELPPPFMCPEPRLIALVLDKQVRGEIRKSDLEGGTIDFWTLEEPPQGIDGPPSMLCQWDVDGNHQNYGAGPRPNHDEFCDQLRQVYAPKPWWRFW